MKFELKQVPEGVNKNNFQLKTSFVFDGNSSVIFLTTSKLKKIEDILNDSIGSDHWASDDSDFFRFKADGSFHSIIVDVPNDNLFSFPDITQLDTVEPNNSLRFKNEFTVAKTHYRYFSADKRFLTCVINADVKKEEMKLFKLSYDFSFLIGIDGGYHGFLLANPLDYLTDNFNGYIDKENSVSDKEYALFEEYLKIVSDNQLRISDDSMTEVVVELSNKILPQIDLIGSEYRRDLIEKTIIGLKDFYL